VEEEDLRWISLNILIIIKLLEKSWKLFIVVYLIVLRLPLINKYGRS